jgi:hypothetical protein
MRPPCVRKIFSIKMLRLLRPAHRRLRPSRSFWNPRRPFAAVFVRPPQTRWDPGESLPESSESALSSCKEPGRVGSWQGWVFPGSDDSCNPTGKPSESYFLPPSDKPGLFCIRRATRPAPTGAREGPANRHHPLEIYWGNMPVQGFPRRHWDEPGESIPPSSRPQVQLKCN